MNKRIEKKRIFINDSAKKTMKDKFGFGSGVFVPGKNTVNLQVKDKATGQIIQEEDSSNLIVYHGRSWMMQRAFGLNLGAIGESGSEQPWLQNDSAAVSDIARTNWSNFYINWVAIGSGGAVDGDHLLMPKQTFSVEYELNNHLSIGGEGLNGENPSGVTNNLRYTHPTDGTGGDWVSPRPERVRDYHQLDPYYPRFLYDPDVVPGVGGTQDPDYDQMEVAETGDNSHPILYEGYKADSYMRALVRVTLAPEEYNGPKYYDPLATGEEYSYINEAGLFISPTYDPTWTGWSTNAYNQMELFAKVNFSSIRKDDTREIVLSWYLYF